MAGRRGIFDASFYIIVALFVGLALAAWWSGGGARLGEGIGDGLQLLRRYGLVLVVAFLAAGLAQKLLPQEFVAGLLGERAGLRGLSLATLAGLLTPSGPFVSMPVAATLYKTGAAPGAVVAYLAAWSLLSLHRLVAWEIPLLGLRLAALRWAICLLLPLAAGLLAQLLKRWLARAGEVA